MKRMVFSWVSVAMLVTLALFASSPPTSWAQTPSPVLTLACDVRPTKIGVGENITCQALADGGVPSSSGYLWRWKKDGETQKSFFGGRIINFPTTFNTTGTHIISINVTDSLGNSRECSTSVTVIGPPIPSCDVSPNPTKVGHPTNFSATVSGGVGNYTWAWTVDGITVATTQNTTYYFTAGEEGAHEVCVTVTDSSGTGPPCCTNVTVNAVLSLACDVRPTKIGVGENITCQALADGGVPSSSGYLWRWKKDGETQKSFFGGRIINFPTTFNTTGTHIISINVTDSLGNSRECSTSVSVTCQPPVAGFSASPTSGCSPLTVTFTDSSTGATSWYWTFTGGNPLTANGAGPHTVIYTSPGTYNVSLRVTNACGEDTKIGYIIAQYCPQPPPPPGGGGGGCPPTRYLTVDWEGRNTTQPLYSNDRLVADLLGLSPDGKNSLFLGQGTSAPVAAGQTYYVITIRELGNVPLPENTVALVAVSITPTGAVFDRDVILILSFSQLPENALEETVRLAYYDDVRRVWEPLKSTRGEQDGVKIVSAALRHFTIFAVLVDVSVAPPPVEPARFVASGLKITPSTQKIWEIVTFVTKIGETVTISANIANKGGEEGTYTAVLKLDGETKGTKTVTLGAEQSQPVSFTVSGLHYGQHEVDLAGLQDDFTTSRTITWWLIVLIVVLVGLIVWGAIWGMRRWRGKRTTQEQ
ncbi:MAG: PKD domain-containing protein [Dehalococcoidia bacterium]